MRHDSACECDLSCSGGEKMRREIRIIHDMQCADRDIRVYRDIVGRYNHLGILIPISLSLYIEREIERLEIKLEMLKNM